MRYGAVVDTPVLSEIGRKPKAQLISPSLQFVAGIMSEDGIHQEWLFEFSQGDRDVDTPFSKNTEATRDDPRS